VPLPDLIAKGPSNSGLAMDVFLRNSLEQFRKLKVSPVEQFDLDRSLFFSQLDRIVHT
jgi:hypothetical protein